MPTKDHGNSPLSQAPSTLEGLRAAAAGCTACPLYLNATQTVFGEGPPDAPIMLIGEQPGDAEDLAGHPFIGPAGKLLDRCLREAGIDRSHVWVTNIVKHFKWVPRGTRRIHSKPGPVEIAACLPWLEAEIRAVAPSVVVALGATAAQGLFGKDFRVTRDRGRFCAIAPCTLFTRHGASFGAAESAGRGDPTSRDPALYRGFAQSLGGRGEISATVNVLLPARILSEAQNRCGRRRRGWQGSLLSPW